jgi:hypothetical protein
MRKLLETPAYRAGRALDDLFCQCLGVEWRSVWRRSEDLKPVSGGDPSAIKDYAKLICKHVEQLNSLVESHREQLLPVSRERLSWPVLMSGHPVLSQDEKTILAVLEVGKGTGRYFDRFSKWPLKGRIACLVDELLLWVNACKNPPGTEWHFPRKGPIRIFGGMDCLYASDGQYCPHPILARLRRQLSPREKDTKRLKPLDGGSFDEWEEFFDAMLEDFFGHPDSAWFMRRFFVTAKSRNSLGLAKGHVKRGVRARLRALTGTKGG